MMMWPDLRAQIARELYIALERLGTDAELLSIVGSCGGPLDDDEILLMLQEHNATGKVLQRPAAMSFGTATLTANLIFERRI